VHQDWVRSPAAAFRAISNIATANIATANIATANIAPKISASFAFTVTSVSMGNLDYETEHGGLQ